MRRRPDVARPAPGRAYASTDRAFRTKVMPPQPRGFGGAGHGVATGRWCMNCRSEAIRAQVLATRGVDGPRSRHELESPSQVQDEIPSEQLVGVRPCTRAAWRHHSVDLRGCHRVVEAGANGSAWRSEEVLQSRDRDRPGAQARLQVAASPSGRLPTVGPVFDGCRSRSARSHHPLSA